MEAFGAIESHDIRGQILPVFCRSGVLFRVSEAEVQVTQQQDDRQPKPSGRIPSMLVIRQAGGKGRWLEHARLTGF